MDDKQKITDKKSRSSRRALLRLMKLFDYDSYDIAIEISDIIRLNPFSIMCSNAAILARIEESEFMFEFICCRRARRVIDQIAYEYFCQSGMTGGAPFVGILPAKALLAAIGSSKHTSVIQSIFPQLTVRIRSPSDYI